MKLDHTRGRYTFANNKWLRLMFNTRKSLDGAEFIFEAGPRYRGPGLWVNFGSHPSLTVWLTANTSGDLIWVCGDCTICEQIYDLPRGSGRRFKWFGERPRG